ncbi:MAG: serine--tRNA ligase [Alphaproteobacteria bacterium]|nr:serine--tRNA ligase [Alphaproteobacteria bacterium]
MIDIKLIRENPDIVRENIKKKFQEAKLPLVDEVRELDKQNRAAITQVEALRAKRTTLSKQIGALMGQGKKDDAEAIKKESQQIGDEIVALEAEQEKLAEEIKKRMMQIPNIIDASVPVGKDDSENVELEKFGEPKVPDFEVPYHTDIMEALDGIDLDNARRVAGNGFYYLKGDIARLHSAILSYARDFMIDRGFTYYVPPFMIRGQVVEGVMSFAEMDAMMYKIEGEDLYLIGTSEHSMIGKFIDQILPEDELPYTLTSYSPCFRKEKGAHGIEERGVYRIHQFEKQEMIVLCKPEDSMNWYNKLWQNTVDFFRSMDIPVRTLDCCSGDLADLKVKSCDVEAWSPRQKKYFEVGSCSTLGDAQARRLKIRVQAKDGKKYFPYTLNNTVVAPPRMLIAFLENNLQADGSVLIPKVLRPYMGGMSVLTPKKK